MEKKEYTPIEAFQAEGGASKRIGSDEYGITWKDNDGTLKKVIGVSATAWHVQGKDENNE